MSLTKANREDGPSTDFKVDPKIEAFQVSAEQLLSKYKDIKVDGIATGTIIFHKDKVLLVQRSATDSMPNLWETPGGACDPEDATILTGAARELWEEAGLQVESMIAEVGPAWFFHTRSGRNIIRYSFVAEARKNPANGEVEVKLSHEHQDFVWASVEEVKNEKTRDKDLPFTSQKQRQVILDAFSARGVRYLGRTGA